MPKPRQNGGRPDEGRNEDRRLGDASRIRSPRKNHSGPSFDVGRDGQREGSGWWRLKVLPNRSSATNPPSISPGKTPTFPLPQAIPATEFNYDSGTTQSPC